MNFEEDEIVSGDELNEISTLFKDLPDNYHEKLLEKITFGRIQFLITAFSGSCWIMMQNSVLLMGFFPDFLQCLWNLNVSQITTMNICHFAGAAVGSVVIGITFDTISKKYSISICTFLMTTFSFGIAFTSSSNLKVFQTCLFFIGFGVGGISLVDSYLADFVHYTKLGLAVTSSHSFANVASILLPLAAYFMFYSVGWKTFMLTIASFYAIVFVISLFLPESPRHYLNKRKKSSYLLSMIKLGHYNGIDISEDISAECEPSYEKQYSTDLTTHSPKLIAGIFLLFALFFMDGTYFFSLVLETNKLKHITNGFQNEKIIFEGDDLRGNFTSGFQKGGLNVDILHYNFSTNNHSNFNETMCTPLTKTDLQLQLVSSAGAFVGGIFITFAINFFGRKKLMIIPYLVSVALQMLFLIHLKFWAIATLVFILRVLMIITYFTLYVYSVEFLPFPVRSRTLGICIVFNYAGNIVSSFVVEYLFLISRSYIFIAIALMAAFIILIVSFIPKSNSWTVN